MVENEGWFGGVLVKVSKGAVVVEVGNTYRSRRGNVCISEGESANG